jgi:hypothetical protein
MSATVALVIALLATVAPSAMAQDAVTPLAGACSYRECALSIAPVWNGLTVVRGSDGRREANLDFFLPRDIAPALRGDVSGAPGADSAFAHAEQAVALRKVGAVLTDMGGVAVVVAIVRAASAGRASRSDQIVGGAGLASLMVSVPLQFAADGALSRAVWWHNLRYAR